MRAIEAKVIDRSSDSAGGRMTLSAVSQWLKEAGRLDAAALQERCGSEGAQPAGRRGSTAVGARRAQADSTHKLRWLSVKVNCTL